MNLKFIERINSNHYIKKEIIFDDDTDILFTDIIKDDKIQNLKYFTHDDTNSEIILTYNYKFKTYDEENKKLIFEKLPSSKFNSEEFLDFKNYIISIFYNQIGYDGETKKITDDLIFFLEDMDVKKFEYIKDISKDYDAIKVIEYEKANNDNLINIDILENDAIHEYEFGKKYIFDMSIINELIIFNKSNNKLYVLSLPLGLDFNVIGIYSVVSKYYSKYKKSLDYSKEILELDVDSIYLTNYKMSNEKHVINNEVLFVDDIDEEKLKRYQKEIKTFFDMDVIIGEYQL